MKLLKKLKGAYRFIIDAFKDIDVQYTLQLERFLYSKKHRHEVCVMRVIGTSNYVKYTPEEILTNRQLKKFVDPDHLLLIKEAHDRIKREQHAIAIEAEDRNGKVHLSSGETVHIDELDKDSSIISLLGNRDIYDIAHSKGFSQGRHISEEMKKAREKEVQGKRRLLKIIRGGRREKPD